MAAIVNDRDVLLQATSPRLEGPSAFKSVSLTAPTTQIHVDAAGTASPSSVTFTATKVNISGTVTFAVSSGTATLTGTTASTTTLTYANMTSSTVTVSASVTDNGVTYTGSFTVSKVVDGATGTPGTSPAIVSLATTGYGYAFDNASATTTASETLTVTATVLTSAGGTGTATFVATAYDAAGTSLGTLTMGGSGNTRTLSAAQFNANGATTTRYAKIVATYGAMTDTLTVYRVDGGADSIVSGLTNEAHTVPADNSGNVTSWSGAATVMKVYKGAVEETASWNFSKADSSGLTTALTGNGTANPTVTASALTVDTGTSTITATRSGYPTQTKVFTISKSKAGATGATGPTGPGGSTGATGTRGAVKRYLSGYGSWSDAVANASLPGGTPIAGDEVTMYSSSFVMMKNYNGSSWVDPGAVVNGNAIVNGTVTAQAMATNSITAANGAIQDLAVGRLKIGNLAYDIQSLYCSGGIINSTYYHGSGRKVVVYGGPWVQSGYPIMSGVVYNMTTTTFDYLISVFNNVGGGYTGYMNVEFGFI